MHNEDQAPSGHSDGRPSRPIPILSAPSSRVSAPPRQKFRQYGELWQLRRVSPLGGQPTPPHSDPCTTMHNEDQVPSGHSDGRPSRPIPILSASSSRVSAPPRQKFRQYGKLWQLRRVSPSGVSPHHHRDPCTRMRNGDRATSGRPDPNWLRFRTPYNRQPTAVRCTRMHRKPAAPQALRPKLASFRTLTCIPPPQLPGAAAQASKGLTTLPATSVSRKSRP